MITMAEISNYIRNLAVFLIFASFITIINPGKKFEHYINLVLGIILIFVLTAPVAGIINALANSSGDIFADISLNYDRAAMSAQIQNADQAGIDLILNMYQDGLQEQAKRLVENHGSFYLENAAFEINTDQKNFGEIISMHLILRPIDSRSPFLRIEPIRIEPIIGSRGEPTQTEQSHVESAQIMSLKNLLSSFYNLDMHNIILETADE
jgi:stage III sporulation protein AF